MRAIPRPPRVLPGPCPKCGGEDVDLAYCPNDECARHASLSRHPLPHPGDEALHCTCARCGFAWVVPTLGGPDKGGAPCVCGGVTSGGASYCPRCAAAMGGR